MTNATQFIDGRTILSLHLRAFLPPPGLFRATQVLIITPTGGSTGPATFVSAREKRKVFSTLGFKTTVVSIDELREGFTISADRTLFIAQNPIQRGQLPAQIISTGIDLDYVSIFPTFVGYAAVVEAVVRCADCLRSDDEVCAIIGAKGRVGRGVANLMRYRVKQLLEVDLGDDLEVVRQASIVISAVGLPGLILPRHLQSAKLVIDVGFSFDEHAGIGRGDVSPTCYSLPLVITPVPGGVGPLQVLTLLERAVFQASCIEFTPWVVKF